jgi:N-acetylglucosamine-6-phosphate deacetylase
MVPPDPQVLRRLYEASRGTLRLLTLAPELDGALEVLDAAVALGVTVAIGHTDATYEQAAEAFARGASVASHLFNAMRPVHHRDPGPVVAAMSAGAGCELVVDGAHLHDAVPAMVFAHAIARPVLVTDAIAAAGLGRARLEVGGQPVTVSDGQARADGTGALAGSTLTLDEALRRAVRTCGVGLAEAVRAASATPARMLGLDAEVGSAGTGTRADLVHLDDELRVVRVLRAGRDVGPRG